MTTRNIYNKLLEAQKKIGAIKKDSDNPFFHSKYFDINSLLSVIKPVLNEAGLVITQALDVRDGKMVLVTKITDVEDSTDISAVMLLPENLDAQKMGGAITYFRRYALQSLLALEAEDDDGNSASKPVKKSYPSRVPPETPAVKDFFKNIEISEEDLIVFDEKLESAKDLKELKDFWSSLPPIAQDKLAQKKEELKKKLSQVGQR